MADISQITLPDGSTYNIKDTTARSTFTSTENGMVPATGSGKNTDTYYLNGAGGWTTPSSQGTTYSTFTSAVDGLAPATGSSKNTTAYFLNGSGTWTQPLNTTYANFTSAAAGLVKASGSSNTTNYVLTGNHAWTSAKLSDTTYTGFTSATASNSGDSGLVPGPGTNSTSTWTTHPGTGTYSKYWLNAAGGWRTIPQFSNTDEGLVPTSGTSNTTAFFLNGSGTWTKPPNTTYDVYSGTGQGLISSTFVSATATSANSASNYFLSKDAQWTRLPGTAYIDTTYAVASTSEAGLMSAADKIKMNKFAFSRAASSTSSKSITAANVSSHYLLTIFWAQGTSSNLAWQYHTIPLASVQASASTWWVGSSAHRVVRVVQSSAGALTLSTSGGAGVAFGYYLC